ncbi:hypothetical protein AB0F20_10280 [Streptomyces goshikiensis]|uniref:hypothetical protein n=1 Tax=Streptomyces goshikiensis TaxID=1942 RepID=UPI0033E6D0B6
MTSPPSSPTLRAAAAAAARAPVLPATQRSSPPYHRRAGTTAYPPNEHTGWVALHYKRAEDGIEDATIHRSTEQDVEADSRAIVEAISAHLGI